MRTLLSIIKDRSATEEDASAIVALFTRPGSKWATKRLDRLRNPYLLIELGPNDLFAHVTFDGTWHAPSNPDIALRVRRLLIDNA